VAARDPVFRGALGLARLFVAGDPERFAATSSADALDALATAEAYSNFGAVELARMAFGAWVRHQAKTPSASRDAKRGVGLGTSLVTSFSRNDDAECELQVAEWIYAAWPADEDVLEAYAEALRFEDPARALAAVKRHVGKNPKHRLAYLVDELAAEIAEAE